MNGYSDSELEKEWIAPRPWDGVLQELGAGEANEAMLGLQAVVLKV
jgi:hypothetical protein